MHRGEKDPRIAAREVSTRKMQMVMGRPLDALQCLLDLHFADADRAAVTPRDSLRATPLKVYKLKTTNTITESDIRLEMLVPIVIAVGTNAHN